MKKLFFALFLITIFLSACQTTEIEATSDPASGNMVQEQNEPPASENDASDTAESVDIPYEVVYDETFAVFNPYNEILSEELLASIGADGFSGTDQEIAEQILQWQNDHMQYIANPMQQKDISYPMRWNYFLPGIFPVSEMVSERVLSNGKIYGLCWDYAAIYCSIATTYGLETRVTAVKKLLSDINPSIDKSTSMGMAFDEYEALNEKLTSHNVAFTFDQIARVARETWAHYRAEVNLDGNWVGMDGSGPVGEGYDEFDEALWYEGYNNKLLYEPNTELAFLESVCAALKNAPMDGYEGITDDAGNPHRAANKYDLNEGKGLAPYFSDAKDAIAFLEPSPEHAQELLMEEAEIQEEFETLTNQNFYIVADALIFSALEEVEAEEYIAYYKALTGDDMPLFIAEQITN